MWQYAVAVDPGETTGLVMAEWIEPDGPLHWTGFTSTSPEATLEYVSKTMQSPAIAVVERAPEASALVATYLLFTRRLLSLGFSLVTISPSDWKPWIKGNPLPKGWARRAGSQHVRDALGMLVYYRAMRHTGATTLPRVLQQLALPI